jgi:hypothetical protein
MRPLRNWPSSRWTSSSRSTKTPMEKDRQWRSQTNGRGSARPKDKDSTICKAQIWTT